MFTQTDLQRLTDIDSFLSLSDREFEYCCKFLLEKAGYGKVFVTTKGPKGGDGGIDLEIHSADRTLVACGQCKRWNGRYNGLMKPLRELGGSMKIRGVSRGIFIITAEATPAEKRDAELLNVEVIDAPALLQLIKKYIPATQAQAQKSSHGLSSTMIKIGLVVFGLFLATVGHYLLGAIVILFTVSSIVFQEAGQANQHGNHEQSYYRPTKQYYWPRKPYHRRFTRRHRNPVW